MNNQTYEEFSHEYLKGLDYSSDSDSLLKFLSKDTSGPFDVSTSPDSLQGLFPEADLENSFIAKEVPKHKSIFGQDKMETYDQI